MADAFVKIFRLLDGLTPAERYAVIVRARELGAAEPQPIEPAVAASTERTRRYRSRLRGVTDGVTDASPGPSPPGHTNGHQPVTESVTGNVTGDEILLLTPPVSSSKGNLSEKDQQLRNTAREILSFMNAKRVGLRPFPPVEANLEPMTARLKEGYDAQDLKSVAAKKWREWGDDPKMKTFFRPRTLFGPKNLAQYIGELGPS